MTEGAMAVEPIVTAAALPATSSWRRTSENNIKYESSIAGQARDGEEMVKEMGMGMGTGMGMGMGGWSVEAVTGVGMEIGVAKEMGMGMMRQTEVGVTGDDD